ncbi:MAG: 4Fe-4S binding protein [Candidatus Omnitrophica bacterium]|nr:4Fe-4S binding protein [Candidatus Omnitrophota bacterium]MBU1047501.1 4Fe-4S binding protein [Candidatus Omnitrophota bacterium]MBU1631032.1 4Fe-4S binding protein [Candidatus Omnitrophota bacterium]MBU1766687.1 4Fe-4S binding protein [Candidatus Omnitrophota bacterium]MBU1888864.1 4Fe-4S binding protein [Candidatus Omnitrophota bacterium]
MMVSKRIVLKFPHRLIEKPIICKLVKEYNLEFNILKAYVTPKEEGLLILELKGKDEDCKGGIDYLNKMGVKVQPLSQDIIFNEARCTHCGVCVTSCPTGALVMDPITRKVHFDDKKCIACELCIPACPVKAMEVHF